MLFEEITNVRKLITSMRDHDNGMALHTNASTADLIEMNLYSIAERVRKLELHHTPTNEPRPEPVISGNVVSFKAFKPTPKNKQRKG